MTRISESREIPFPADIVWPVLSAFGNVHRRHTAVESSVLLSDQAAGTGATRRCNSYCEDEAVEKVVDWREGESFTLKVEQKAIPAERMTATYRVAPVGLRVSLVSVVWEYRPRYGPFGWFLDRTGLRSRVRGVAAKALQGVEDHLRTGRLVGHKRWRLTAADRAIQLGGALCGGLKAGKTSSSRMSHPANLKRRLIESWN